MTGMAAAGVHTEDTWSVHASEMIVRFLLRSRWLDLAAAAHRCVITPEADVNVPRVLYFLV